MPTQEARILDIDLGNSALKYRCGERRGRLEYSAGLTLPDIEFSGARRPDRVRVASVLTPEQDAQFAEQVMARWECSCEFAGSTAATAGVRNGYTAPETLGVDRWLAAIAGFNHVGGAVLVADLGTAATLDYVDASGNHLGGYIVPGSALMRRSLLSETAAIRFDDAALLDKLNPGKQTRDAVERGTLLALVQLIDGELERFNKLCHHDGRSGARLILCGGGADSVAAHLQGAFEVIPDLVLDGLALALP